MSDLVVSVRQISNYPQLTSSDGTEAVLVQQDGLGGPYATLSTADLVATALHGGPALGVGVAPPANADGGQIFSGEFVMPADGAAAWNAYTDTTSIWRLLNAGSAASIGWDPAGGFNVAISTAGSAGDALTWVSQLLLSNAGNLTLPYGTLTVARDPAYAMEVATLNYVSNHTVASFNARTGGVTLNQADIYTALCLDSPIASQNYVNQAIKIGLENLLTTCPFVNRWNNRTGSVYLMLADIECVFYQSGQIPMSPTPPANSNDDSIATTKWVTQEYAPVTVATVPPANPISGRLWWDDVGGQLYVWYVDATSAQWVIANNPDGAFLSVGGGTLTGGLTIHLPRDAPPDGLTVLGDQPSVSIGDTTGSHHSETAFLSMDSIINDIIYLNSSLGPRWTLRFDPGGTGGIPGQAPFSLVGYTTRGLSPLVVAFTFDNVTGLGQVWGDPVAPLGIATKQYVDNNVRSLAPAQPAEVTGSHGDIPALVSLLSALASLGLISDRTTS